MFPRTPSRFLSVFLHSLLVSSLVSRGNSVEISWFGPKISQSGKISGYFAGIPGTPPVFCRFPRSVSPFRFCPRPALRRLRETRELPEWSTKHPLVSLEISGNAKCWGPSRFLFGFRKHGYRPTSSGRCRVSCLFIDYFLWLGRLFWILPPSNAWPAQAFPDRGSPALCVSGNFQSVKPKC